MMKRAWMRDWILALALIAMSTVALAGGWKELASEGLRHFVLVEVASANDEATYREAASTICPMGKACLVLYWTDESNAASKMPLSSTQSQAVVAQFRRNPTTGQDELLTRCAGADASARCLKNP